MPNHLVDEASPYLQQHANNPVDWYPWTQNALSLARQQNKPILLSIGYASCHWCHVMAHESFEDIETARLMNELFINIKVDREERPDLDKIYQMAHYLLVRRSGGWPLTIFLTPDDLTPFYSGTYFPRESRYNLPAFKDILRGIADAYKTQQNEIKSQNLELTKILNSQSTTELSALKIDTKPLENALKIFQEKYDTINGGFSGAPKFPNSTAMEFLLHYHSPMAFETLRHMAEGGIYDQIGGGFFRYTVDAGWQIPHFEKMLYDNAQLLFVYAFAYKQKPDPLFARVVRQTADWILTKMQSTLGGFFSSMNADSEGAEGKYYVWTKDEISQILNEKEMQFAEVYFGLKNPPNFEYFWHLNVNTSLEKTAEKLSLQDAPEILQRIQQKLLAARNKRTSPSIDKKILNAWNGLMIKALLVAGNVLTEPRWVAAAEQALTFIRQKMWNKQQLLACYKDGKAYVPAYLDDYAFLLDALVHTLQISKNDVLMEFAVQIAEKLLAEFYDSTSGGFYFTSDQHEKLLYRPKTMADEALPSGNGLAVRSLLKLGQMLNENRYMDAAEKTVQAVLPALNQFPIEHATLLLALKEMTEPPQCDSPYCSIS